MAAGTAQPPRVTEALANVMSDVDLSYVRPRTLGG